MVVTCQAVCTGLGLRAMEVLAALEAKLVSVQVGYVSGGKSLTACLQSEQCSVLCCSVHKEQVKLPSLSCTLRMPRGPLLAMARGSKPLQTIASPFHLAGLPDVEQVVVAAGRQLAAGGAPLEAAHLLLVPRQPLLDVVPLPAAATFWTQEGVWGPRCC